MAVVPRRGDALLFWDMHPNGTEVDRASLHASCPTIKVCLGFGCLLGGCWWRGVVWELNDSQLVVWWYIFPKQGR